MKTNHERSIPSERSSDGGGKDHVKVGGSDNAIGGESVDQKHGNHTARQVSKESPEPLIERGINSQQRRFIS